MSIIRGFLAVLLGVVCVIGAAANLVVAWRLMTTRNETEIRTPSMLPLVSGVAGAVALLLWPYRSLVPFVWVPLLLDPGTLPYLAVGAFAVLREPWTTPPQTYLEAFRSEDADGATINLTLYPKSRFVAVKAIPPRTSISVGGKWRAEHELLVLNLGGAEITFKAVSDPARNGKRSGAVHSDYVWTSSSQPTILDGIALQRHEAEQFMPHRNHV